MCRICGAEPCYAICVNSPDYYSPEREREDALFSEAFPERLDYNLGDDMANQKAWEAEQAENNKVAPQVPTVKVLNDRVYMTVMEGVRGWFACIVDAEDGPFTTGIEAFDRKHRALLDAAWWAMAEEIPVTQEIRDAFDHDQKWEKAVDAYDPSDDIPF